MLKKDRELRAGASHAHVERVLVPRSEAERESHQACTALTLFEVSKRRALAGVIKTQDRPAVERNGVARGAW